MRKLIILFFVIFLMACAKQPQMNLPNISKEDIAEHCASEETFALYVYAKNDQNNSVVEAYAQEQFIPIYAIEKSTYDNNVVTPALILFEKGTQISEINAIDNKDYFDSISNLSNWFHEEIGLDIVEDDSGCEITSCG